MNNKRVFIFLSFLLAMLSVTGLLLLLDSNLAAAAPQAIPFPDQRQAVEAGVEWLIENKQNEDGGFGVDFGTGQPASAPAATLDAIMAIAAAGYNPGALYIGQTASPIDYLENNVEELITFAKFTGGSAGKVVLALSAASQNPREFAANDWVLTLTEQYSPTGQYNTSDGFNQSLAIMALTAVNEPVPEKAVTWLIDQQADDGSWDDGFGTLQNADATAMSIMALAASDVPAADPVLAEALDFLRASQLATGGWEYGPGYGENANSTGLVVQALAAAGEDFYTSDGPWSKDGRSPLTVLLSWQSSTGAFQADFGQGPFDDFFATVQAIPAATGKPLPLPARFEAAQYAAACLATIQDEETGGWEQFAGFGVNAAGTSRAIQAVAAVGQDPQSGAWTPGTINAVEALEALTPAYLSAERGGRVGIVIQGVVAAGDPYDAADFAGYDLPLKLAGYLSPTGEYANTAFGVVAHDEAMLGLMAAGEMVDPAAVDFLLDAQIDGDWGAPDGNGISLHVLGRLGISVPEAIDNLRGTQEADGGWGFGVPSDPSSSSEIVQGLIQNKENPFSPGWSKVANGTISNAADMVLGQQGASGCWPNRWGPGEDPFATTDGIMLLVQQPDWGLRSAYLPVVRSE